MRPCFDDFLERLKDFQENRDLFVTVSVLTAFKIQEKVCKESSNPSLSDIFGWFETCLSHDLKCLADFRHHERLISSAERLCHLEAQVFLNEEQKEELPLAKIEWQRAALEFANFCHSKNISPASLSGKNSAFHLRLLASILVSQKEWVSDVDFFAVDTASKGAIFLESPVFTVSIFSERIS